MYFSKGDLVEATFRVTEEALKRDMPTALFFEFVKGAYAVYNALAGEEKKE